MTIALAYILSLLLAQAPPSVSPKEKAKAQALLDQASRLYDKHEYAQALEKFNAAYAIYPSPNLLYNIGQTYDDLAKPLEALDTFERFLAATEEDASGAFQQQRKDALASLDVLKGKVGRLHILCETPGAEIRVDGKKIGTAPMPGPVPVLPGSHQVTASMTEGYFPALKNVDVGAGELKAFTIDLQAIPPPPPPPAAEPPQPTPAEVAAEHERKAKLLCEAGNFGAAIVELEAAYVITADPTTLYNIGEVHRLAKNPQQAIDAYKRYLDRQPEAENGPYVRGLIAELEQSIAPPPPVTPPPAPPQVAPAWPAQKPMPMAPSQPHVATSSAGGAVAGSYSGLAWFSTIVGIVGAGVGVATGAALLVKKDELDSSGSCESNRCDSSQHDTIDSYNSLRPFCTAGLVVGLVGLGLGTTLFLIEPSPDKTSISATLGPGTASLQGRF